jgi:tetratricopeptide (TPR) repeat protein
VPPDRNVVLKAAWTPDGRSAAVLSNVGKTVSVFDMLTGQEQLVLSVPPAGSVFAKPGGVPAGQPDAGRFPFSTEARPAFADAGKRLLVGLADGRVLAWDTQWPEPPAADAPSGFWKAEGRELVQELAAGGALFFGDPGWVDYDAEVEVSPAGVGLLGLAVIARGNVALEALVHSGPEGKSGLWQQDPAANHELKCRQEASGLKEALAPGRWYRLNVSVRGSHVTMMLDNRTLCEYRPSWSRGRVGLVSRGTAARFRDVRVTHAHEVVLWDRLPLPPPPPPEKLAALHVQAGERLLAAGKLNDALAEFRLGMQADLTNVPARRQAGLLLARLGSREEALDILRQLSLDASLWPLLQDLRRGLIAEKLPEFVAGKRKARDVQEKVILCSLCAAGDYPLAGARLYRELFAEHPGYRGAAGISDQDREPYRADAARAAARAGSGQGKDAAPLPEGERRAWRRQARAWLETELRLQTRLGNDSSVNSVLLRQLLRGWQRDPGFAGVRGEALARVPADERTAWQKLWAEIDSWQQTALALSYGAWRAEPQGLAQDQAVGEYVWLVGEPSWADVTVEVEVLARDGGGELGVLVRAREADDMVRAVLDGWGHTAQGIITLSPGQGGINLGSKQAAPLEPNRWYRVRVEAHGKRFRLFVDDRLLVDAREQGFGSGRVGLFTLYRAARFRGFKVTDPRGEALFQGVKPPSDGNGYYARAHALHRRGRPGEAIPLYVEALKHHPDEPAAVFTRLGLAHEEVGQLEQAVLALRKALAGGQQQASADLARVEKRRQTLEQLRQWEAGERPVAEPQDVLKLALSARDDCQRYVTSTRLFSTYLERVAQPRFGDPPPPLKRPFNGVTEYYEAACSAARAGTGQGDGADLPEVEWAKLRGQALDWLSVELGRYQQVFRERPRSVAGWLRMFTRHWQQDHDLERVRSRDALEALPEKERAKWRKLWRDVAELQKNADASRAGAWRIEGKELVQEDASVPCIGLLTFGDAKWQDHDIELEAQVAGDAGEIAILFRAADEHDFLAALLGSWETRQVLWNVQRYQRHAVGQFEGGKGQRIIGPFVEGKFDPGRWSRVRLEVRGRRVALFLDNRKVLEADGLPRSQGRVGLRTLNCSARFRGLKVVDPQGKVLFEGLPALPRDDR